jgi:phytoene synthase
MASMSAASELNAAGIREPRLRASFQQCRALNAEHGKTYFLATRLLPPDRRPYVHALYGFARYADEIVDDMSRPHSVHERERRLDDLSATFLTDLRRGYSAHPIGRALVHTFERWSIPTEHVAAFLASMRMDLTVTEYETFEDLDTYVYGSAAVIGLQMLPILLGRPISTRPGEQSGSVADEVRRIGAMDLGRAFQLANFVRDVGEDLDRGRLYIPLEDLERVGLTRTDIERRVVTPPVRDLLAHQIARVRDFSTSAAAGIDLLPATSRPCIEAAQELYVGIVDEVEQINYEVFTHRARTSTWRRASVAVPALMSALSARQSALT